MAPAISRAAKAARAQAMAPVMQPISNSPPWRPSRAVRAATSIWSRAPMPARKQAHRAHRAAFMRLCRCDGAAQGLRDGRRAGLQAGGILGRHGGFCGGVP
jgi:hypothetical protein